MTPLVSVLVPAYNGERYIGEALDSALAQTHANLEILVGDDGSSDATPDIVADMAGRDSRIRLIRHPENLGAPANQIALHREARGEFIKPLLQDDLLERDCVARLLAHIAHNPGVALSFGRRSLINEVGDPLPDQVWNRRLLDEDTLLDGWQLGSAMLEASRNHVGEVTCALYRAAAVGDLDHLWHIGDHQYGPIGDVALWLKLLAQGLAAYTPETLSAFRQHGAQSSTRPEVQLGGLLEWGLAVLDAPRLGHLSSPRAERHALTSSLVLATRGLQQAAHDPTWSPRLREVTARLSDRLGAPELAPPTTWYPVALAAPAPTAEALGASVRRLRGLAQDEVVGRCVIAVAPDTVDAAVAHVEHALRSGPDFPLELEPSTDPGAIVDGAWLAVVTDGGSWADGASARIAA